MPVKPPRPWRALLIAAALAPGLTGCDAIQQKLGIEDPEARATRNEAEGKAVGGACRQSGRAIEDCYSVYHWLPKSSIYEGWRDMDAYMRENRIETVEPQLPPVSAPGTKKKARPRQAEAPPDTAEKAAEKQ